jgi:hypothetical protein
MTDIEWIGLFCGSHHRHVHVESLYVVREQYGGVSIRDRSTHELVVRGHTRRPVAVAA